MASKSTSPAGDEQQVYPPGNESDETVQGKVTIADQPKKQKAENKTPEPLPEQQHAAANVNTPSTPGVLPPFDWEDFDARYEKALREANEKEQRVLKEADNLSKVCNQHRLHTCL